MPTAAEIAAAQQQQLMQQQAAAAEQQALQPMTVGQFATYVAEERQNFRDFFSEDREQRNHNRRECRQEHQERKEMMLAEWEAQRVPPCDGSSHQEVREWLKEMDVTANQTQWTIYIACRTAKGDLRHEIERFLRGQQDRHNVDWGALKAHLQTSFLSPHEKEKLRHDLRKINQSAYESITSYARRFRELADIAYPTARVAGQDVRNEDQNEILLAAFTSGLRERSILKRLIKEGQPETYERAVTLVTKYESDEYKFKIALKGATVMREEEPMEVGAIFRVANKPEKPQDPEVQEIKRQVTGLTEQFTKLMATLQKNGEIQKGGKTRNGGSKENAHSKPRYRFTEEGKPICNHCNRQGHTRRVCPDRQGSEFRPTLNHSAQSGGR